MRPQPLIAVADVEATSRFYQKLLGGFDFIALQPELPALMTRARERGVGVIAMKTLMGARLNDLRPYEHGGATFAQAAFRWVLASGYADALVVSMNTRVATPSGVFTSSTSALPSGACAVPIHRNGVSLVSSSAIRSRLTSLCRLRR